VVFLGVGLWLAASLLLGPWPGKRSRLINEVLQARAEDVVAIEVAPHPNETCASLVGVPRTIADRADISRLCQALREARSCSLNHPRSLWSAVLTLRKRTGAFACVVANTDQGVLLRFLSNADRGWMFGVFASADLGGILKAIVKAGDKDQ
jgi:hypothetical protein